MLGKVALAPGDRYDGTKIDDALRKLYRGGLFRKVTIAETQLADVQRVITTAAARVRARLPELP